MGDERRGNDFLVDRRDLQRCRWSDPADDIALEPGPGEILVEIERFSFTANNITYALTGERFGYWRYFPAPDPLGIVPVWGIARVVETRVPEIEDGERIYGFWPTSRRLVIRPAEIVRARFVDDTEHRRDLPRTYNEYVRLDLDPDYDEAQADQHLVLRPLFSLGFFLGAHLAEIGPELRQVVISSASSKTALALAFLLKRQAPEIEIIGLTRAASVETTARVGRYDRVLSYDEIDALPDHPGAYVDISGDAALLAAIHRRLGTRLLHSIGVGFTRGAAGKPAPLPADLPGPKPEFFFTPTHILRQRERLGAAVLRERIADSWQAFLAEISPRLTIETHTGADKLEGVYRDVLDGRAPPDRAAIVAFTPASPRSREVESHVDATG